MNGLAVVVSMGVLLGSLLVTTARTQTALDLPSLIDRIGTVRQRLSQLKQETTRGVPFVERLEAARRQAEGLPAPWASGWSAPGLVDARRAQIRMWVELLELVERDIDPTFNPALEPPTRQVTPFVQQDGAIFQPATSQDITDPVRRADFEQTVQANLARNERYNVQTRLGRMRETVQGHIGRFLKPLHDADPSARQDLESALAASVLTGSTKSALAAFIQ